MIAKIIFILSIGLIFNALVGYPLVLLLLDRFAGKQMIKKDLSLRPMVSLIVAAYNEEKSIGDKLANLCKLDYPPELLEIIIVSDRSNDGTHSIVEDFITSNRSHDIRLIVMEERGGKTLAQNEGVRQSRGELLVFSDANAMLDSRAVMELASFFTEKDVIYVAGRLVYINESATSTSYSEAKYWNLDLFMRRVESEVKTIVSGNGALYAIKREDYIDFDSIMSHDSSMPYYAALNHKRALYNSQALAYEKASTKAEDEFKRKVRMFRSGIKPFFTDLRKYNPFQYGWYSYFYFSHRATRRSLFIFHLTALVSNLFLTQGIFGLTLALQLAFYGLALMAHVFGLTSKIFHYPYYYCLTIVAQLVGMINIWTKKATPYWEKSKSTR